MIPWREHSVPITITFPPIAHAIEYKIRTGINDEIDIIRSQMRDCASKHSIFVAYRRYRRGKNRCKYCGCKLHG